MVMTAIAPRVVRFPHGTATRTPMYAHQVGGVAQMVRRGRDAGYYALLDECGLGKTIQAIYALRELRASGVVERAVVLCKCDLIRNWREEFSRHAPDWRVRSLQ